MLEDMNAKFQLFLTSIFPILTEPFCNSIWVDIAWVDNFSYVFKNG